MTCGGTKSTWEGGREESETLIHTVQFSSEVVGQLQRYQTHPYYYKYKNITKNVQRCRDGNAKKCSNKV